MLHIGQIDYLNCTPIFSSFKKLFPDQIYSFDKGVPAILNQKLRDGEIDVCPSSSIEYARNPEKYYIMPDLSISADGPVKSVMLFSKRPIQELDKTSIALTGESATSVILLKTLLARKFKFKNSFETSNESLETLFKNHEAVLLIGDNALRNAAIYKDSCIIYDMGLLWKDFTGLPFVFALWFIGRESAERNMSQALDLHKRLVIAKHDSLKNLTEIAKTCTEYQWIKFQELAEYWQCLSYDLTERHLEGLKLFYHYAALEGFLPKEPAIDMLPTR